MKEKITFLSGCDYANVLTNINICIQSYSKNYDSICVCIHPHPFKYTINHEFNLSLIEKLDKAGSEEVELLEGISATLLIQKQ